MYKIEKINLRDRLLKLSTQDSHEQVKDHILDIIKNIDENQEIPEDNILNEKLEENKNIVNEDYKDQSDTERKLVKRIIDNIKNDDKFLLRGKVLNILEKK